MRVLNSDANLIVFGSIGRICFVILAGFMSMLAAVKPLDTVKLAGA